MTQPASGSVTAVVSPNPLPVTGTFWQATQPISGSVTATISGVNITMIVPPGLGTVLLADYRRR